MCVCVCVQGQELTVRQMALLGFRDLVLLKLSLETLLPNAPLPHPPPITQMLLILQVNVCTPISVLVHSVTFPSILYTYISLLISYYKL